MDFCCQLWKSVAEEIKRGYLAQLKEAEDKGVPAFALLPQKETIEAWGEYCPRCGKSLITGKVVEKAMEKVVNEPVAKKPIVQKVCPKCGGKKIIAGKGTDDPIKCMHCHGEGVIDAHHFIDDSGGGLKESGVIRGN